MSTSIVGGCIVHWFAPRGARSWLRKVCFLTFTNRFLITVIYERLIPAKPLCYSSFKNIQNWFGEIISHDKSCTASNLVSSVTVALFVHCFDRSEFQEGGRNAFSFPDFLLINPGEWQGWHRLIPRFREAPGILAPSKHRELPRLEFHCSLIPTHSSTHMKFPIFPSTAHLWAHIGEVSSTLKLYPRFHPAQEQKPEDLTDFRKQITGKLQLKLCCVLLPWPALQPYG